MNIRTLLIIAFSGLVAACGSIDVKAYAQNNPKFDLAEYFNGTLTAHGIVKNRGGKVIRHFNVLLEGTWDEQGRGELYEEFLFDDGEAQTRTWIFEPREDGTFRATANDVVGEATPMSSGNALFMEYVLTVPYKNSTINVTVDDRMYLTNDTVLINESTLKKFGIRVGEVVLTIVKQP